MKVGKSYFKDIGDFLENFKNLGNIPSTAILVTVGVVGLYPSIPHNTGLQALYEKLKERADKKISFTDLVEKVDFILNFKYLVPATLLKISLNRSFLGYFLNY